MSDILIKNMEIPKDYKYVDVRIFCDGTATTSSAEEPFYKRMDVVEVPTPHGKLIDADAYHKEIRERYESARECYKGAKTDDIKARAESALFTFTECSLTLRKMPTIIEAEET